METGELSMPPIVKYIYIYCAERVAHVLDFTSMYSYFVMWKNSEKLNTTYVYLLEKK